MQNYKSKSKIFSIVSLTILIFALLFLIFQPPGANGKAEALNSFARCLTDRGFVMYGAYWCPHCQNEKAAFGVSFQYVKYVECAKEPKACTEAGIKGFPTWISGDGRRFEGEQGLEKLTEASGCIVPVNE
jgi:hypothetical protein